MKRTFSTELAYVFGIVFVAWGVVLMEKADFGVSMVVAPAYLLYRWLSPAWSFVTFGMAEYCLQAVLLLAMCLLLRRFRVSYLFSFVTAVVYGFVLDAFMLLGAALPAGRRLAARDLLCAGDAFLRGRCFRHVPHLHFTRGLRAICEGGLRPFWCKHQPVQNRV